MTSRPKVVIVGAGFGGLNAARSLAAAEVDVTLVDRNNFHTFQPLLYQVATAGLNAADVAHAVRGIVRGLGNVAFRLGSWWAPLPGERFDLVASNPPYIAAADPHLDQGDLRFEPASALASGADGLDDIRQIIEGAPAHLHAGGWLLLEHGWDQGAAVAGLLRERGFEAVETMPDLEARDRVSLGRWPG